MSSVAVLTGATVGRIDSCRLVIQTPIAINLKYRVGP